jgi:hypothetical protein
MVMYITDSVPRVGYIYNTGTGAPAASYCCC